MVATQVSGALFAHCPTQGIDDIGLAASVGADHRGNTGSDFYNGLLGKRLKADHFKAF
jgi:hypothetical protein